MPRIEPPDFKPPRKQFEDFPPSYQRLKRAYKGFVPEVEHNRDTFGRWLGTLVEGTDLDDAESVLVTTGADETLPIPELLQRCFYWSATCFIRSFQLVLAYLVLDHRALASWAQVTGYYSRFYGAKAISNLCLAGWVHVGVPARQNGKKHRDLLLYVADTGVRLTAANATGQFGRGSHERWWRLFDQLRLTPDFPPSEALELAFQPWPFTLERRHELNYSDAWMRGFPELEWFDQPVDQMLAHASAARPRPDRDFTDLNRFFEGCDPEHADVGDFYSDEIHWLWQPVLAYLELVRSLVPEQKFITSKKLVALAERALAAEFPVILAGMERALLASVGRKDDL